MTDFTKEELVLMEDVLHEKLFSYTGFLKVSPKDNWCSARKQITESAIEKIKELKKNDLRF